MKIILYKWILCMHVFLGIYLLEDAICLIAKGHLGLFICLLDSRMLPLRGTCQTIYQRELFWGITE